MKLNLFLKRILFTFIFSLPMSALTAEVPPEGISSQKEISNYSDTLFGNWNGTRSDMYSQGYDLEIIYKLDFLNNSSSSNSRIYGLDNLDIKLNIDIEKSAGIKGASALLQILSNRGDKPGAHSNRLPHGLDNIETPSNGNTTKLYQAWLQQLFLDERISLLAGLYDLNSEFYATESSGIFIHPTFGIGAEMAGTGKNGPSIFPTTSFGLRLKTIPSAGYYLQLVTLDGVPGDPNNPQGTHVQFNEGDGTLNVIEGGIPLSSVENAHNNKLALGIWRYTATFDDILDVDASGNPIKKASHGIYAIIDKVFKYQSDATTEMISGFFRFGSTEGDTSQFDHAMSTGVVWTGTFPGREQDKLGIAYAQEHNSEKYRIASGNQVRYENSLELGYMYRARNGLVIQPFVQYLMNHSSDISQDKTWWLGLRIQASF